MQKRCIKDHCISFVTVQNTSYTLTNQKTFGLKEILQSFFKVLGTPENAMTRLQENRGRRCEVRRTSALPSRRKGNNPFLYRGSIIVG